MARKFTIKFDDGTEINGIEHERFSKSTNDLHVLRFTENTARMRMRKLVEETVTRAKQSGLADKHIATEVLAAIHNNKEFVAALEDLVTDNFQTGRSGGLGVSAATQARELLSKFGFGSSI